MSKPTHIAYIVTEPREGSNRDPVWNAVGAVWPHGRGDGFDLVLNDQLAVSGRIVIRARKEKVTEAEDADATA